MKRFSLPIAALALFAAACSAAFSRAESADWLQVPSPDWRDQVIYFLMTDRFENGDPSNDDQGAGEYDPRDNAHYSGGDLRGILKRLDYIRGLGATAVWITPPVANQWWNPWANYSGYHGYWAENFTNVDKHYGTLADYRALSAELHRNGMYLVQDIVCNHTGDFFRYTNWDSNDPAKGFELNAGSKPSPHPSQWPFSLNDARDPVQAASNVYHWTPDITDFRDTNQIFNFQLSGLDDLNTENPAVIDALKDSYDYWIREAGVDAFRVDTALYVPHAFWRDFVHSSDPAHPGVSNYAASLGKTGFHTFGEVWVNSKPLDDEGARTAASFTGTAEEPELGGVIQFPIQIELQRVFAEGKPTLFLAAAISNHMRVFRNPWLQVNFVDNHDMNRFLVSASVFAYRQALLTVFCIPGIPAVYYGTEQGFTDTRAAMFAKGYHSGGTDHFDTNAPMYRFVRDLIALRRNNAVLRRGTPELLKSSPAGPGIIAYRMRLGADKAYVILNSADSVTLLDNLETGLPEGTQLKLLYGLLKTDAGLTVGRNGRVTARLMPRDGMVLVPSGETTEAGNVPASLSVEKFPSETVLSKNIPVRGLANGVEKLVLVVDGDIAKGVKIRATNGSWEGVLPVEDLENGTHSFSAYSSERPEGLVVSESVPFTVAVDYRPAGSWTDPAGDDHGPRGTYTYPVDPGFRNTCDILGMDAFIGGRNLKVRLKMNGRLSTMWNPKYGFDHVSFCVFFDVPSAGGQTARTAVLPFLNADAPAGRTWTHLAVLGGWMSYLYTAKDADPENFGTPVSPAPKLSGDRDAGTVEFTLPAKALGNPASLSGIGIYVTTWDYDGLENRFRSLAEKAGSMIFGGGKPGDPLIMDDIGWCDIR
jgi:glycosidase